MIMISNTVIRRQIADAIAIPGSNLQLRQYLQQLIFDQRGYYDADSALQLETLLLALIQELPDNLKSLVDAANNQGVGHLLLPVIELIGQYYLLANDFIPDQAGLLGLLDDIAVLDWMKYIEVLTK